MLEYFWEGFTKAASGANIIKALTKSNVTKDARVLPVRFRNITPKPAFKGQIPVQKTTAAVENAVSNVAETPSINYSKLPETLGKLTGPEQIARRSMLYQGGTHTS